MRIEFTVYGNPKAQKRHRTSTKDKQGNPLPFPRRHDPSATDKADFLAQTMEHRPETPLICPLDLLVSFVFPRPTSHYGTGRNAGKLKASAPAFHVTKPDLDNCLKLVLDALNGVFFLDDRQIMHINAYKLYGDTPCTEIAIMTR